MKRYLISCWTTAWTTIQDTFKALEEAGFEVSAYEGLGLTLDSKAESWLLIVTVG